MKKQILFIGGTHGDEPIGVRTLQEISEERSDFDWLVGNEPALAQNTREFEGNLNRSAPGKKNSPLYAPRRAAEILELTQNYEAVIDLHGTTQTTGIFIILTNPKPENWRLASQLTINNIIYWPSFSQELSGPLSEFFACGLEIECGPKDDLKTKEALKKIIKKFLDQEGNTESQNIFEVYGSYSGPNAGLEEFEKTVVGGEEFYPLLIGVYPEITCYKMKKTN